jgi:tetratricopeptide (TPR) repeat protein
LNHPSLAELAALCEGTLSPDRQREALRHLLFQRCADCLAAAPPMLRLLLGLETVHSPTSQEDDAYDAAIERAAGKALEYERRLRLVRDQAQEGLRVLSAGVGRRLPKNLEPLAKMRALLDRSWQLRYENPIQMERLARSAVKVSLRLRHGVHGAEQVADYQAEAFTELGNACRAANHFEAALDVLGKARELFERGTRDPLLEVRLLEVEASLHADLRQFGVATHKLAKVLRFYRRHKDNHRFGRTLVLIGLYTGYAGNFERGIHRLEQSLKLIDAERDPGLACAAAHNLILFLVECDRIPEARKLRILYSRHLVNAGGRINQVKFRAVEACIDAGLGNHARAEAIFREVKEGYAEAGLMIPAGGIALDLAAVLLRQGKTREAKSAVLEAAQIFIAHRIQREALQAVALLRDTFEVGRGTLEMVLEVTAYLRRLEIDPALRFEGRTWEPI